MVIYRLQYTLSWKFEAVHIRTLLVLAAAEKHVKHVEQSRDLRSIDISEPCSRSITPTSHSTERCSAVVHNHSQDGII